MSCTVYSVYDYENDKLKTVVDREVIVGHVAAMYGFASVVDYCQKPTILVSHEESDGTGPGTTHLYYYDLYQYPNMTVDHCLQHKSWSDYSDTYYINGAKVTESAMVEELRSCEGLSVWERGGITYEQNDWTLTELLAYLQG